MVLTTKQHSNKNAEHDEDTVSLDFSEHFSLCSPDVG